MIHSRWLILLCTWLSCLQGRLHAETPVHLLRDQSGELQQRGLWRELVDHYQAKLESVNDAQSGKDLERVSMAIGQLGAWQEWDALIERSVKLKPKNPHLLRSAANLYRNVPHEGELVAGEFRRGMTARFGRRFVDGPGSPTAGSASGNAIDTAHRDRIRALQLLRQAIDASDPLPTLQAQIWGDIATTLMPDQAWQLQVLTSLEALPEWDATGPEGGTEGAPWSGQAPVLHSLPASWAEARSDGERWRLALAEQARLDPKLMVTSTLALAQFSESQFGTETLASFDWWRSLPPDRAEGMLAIDTLSEEECLANTSVGVRRFRLPADHHFIALYRSIAAQEPTAADALVQTFLNRRQYHLARQSLEQAIRWHGEGPEKRRQQLMQQITGNWGRFAAIDPVPVGRKPVIPIDFRNAKSIKLSAAPVDMDGLLRATLERIRTESDSLQWYDYRPAQIAQRLLEDPKSQWIGNTAAEWQETLTPREHHRDTRGHVTLPIDRAGAWWVTARMPDGNTFHTLVWIVDSVLVKRQVNDQTRWWLADANDGTPVPNAPVEFFGFRHEHQPGQPHELRRPVLKTKELARTTAVDGTVLINPADWDERCHWLAVARPPGRAPTFMGFDSFDWSHSAPDPDARDLSYAVSDRPIYRPGDVVQLKGFLRQVSYLRIDAARWANRPAKLAVFNGRGEAVVRLDALRTDAEGDVETSFTIPKDAVLGQWTAGIEVEASETDQTHSAQLTFRVEEFRKPEFEVNVTAPEQPVKLGSTFEATISARYFHGAPVRQGSVEVTVKRNTPRQPWFPSWRWDWLYGKGNWWNSPAADWHPHWPQWGCLPPLPPWMESSRWTPEELVMKQTLPIGPDGLVRISVDTSAAKAAHGDVDSIFSISAAVTDATRREEQASCEVAATRKPFSAAIWTEPGYAAPGAEVTTQVSAATISGTPVAQAQGSIKLLKLSMKGQAVEETELQSWPISTDTAGTATLRFQAPDAGQYRLSLTLSLPNQEAVEAGTILNVHGPGKADPTQWQFGPLEVVSDQISYAPGSTAKLRINSDHPNATVHLFLHMRDGTAREVRQLRLDGKSLECDLPLTERDMPNTFVDAVTVHGAKVHTFRKALLIPPASRMLEVSLEPEMAQVKPGQQSFVTLKVRDAEGQPFVGESVLTIYDQALEAITGGSPIGPIQEAFWAWKHSPGGLREQDSLPPACGNLVRSHDQSMEPLGLFGGSDEPSAPILQRRGGPRAMMMEATLGGAPMPMAAAAPAAMEDAIMKSSPADDASSGKPGAPITMRKDFADLLLWSGSIQTDAAGLARIPVRFPDNLTTWKARVWSIGPDTRVGETTTEITATKPLLIQLNTPRFLVQGDQASLAVLVQNHHPTPKTVQLTLNTPAGPLKSLSAGSRELTIPAQSELLVDWEVLAESTGEALVQVEARANDDGDALERRFPVLVRGMLRQDAWSRRIEPDQTACRIDFEIPAERREAQTRLTLRYSPSIAGAVIDAIPYLASYPHGCTEQTLNRFVPAVVAQAMLKNMGVPLADIRKKRTNLNPQELGHSGTRAAQWKLWAENPVFDEAQLADMVRSGITRLESMQNRDGGWGWFSGFGEASYPHTTCVVVHGLLAAKAHGAAVPAAMLERGTQWLAAYEERQLRALKLHEERQALRQAGKEVPNDTQYEKSRCDAEDALLRQILGTAGVNQPEMVARLHRDRLALPPYAQALLGLEHHRLNDTTNRDEILRVMSQFLRRDAENQTCFLELPNQNYWWSWYGSNHETHAWFLKLLTRVNPNHPDARGLVKYLLNQRKHAASWDSTRDTAEAIHALAEWFQASGEDQPDLEVEVLLDGKSLDRQRITREDWLTFDGTLVLDAKQLTTGKHTLEVRKSGRGPLYVNAYLEVFTLEDQLRAAGLEVKSRRLFHRLIPLQTDVAVPDASGQAIAQNTERFRREPLTKDTMLKSGDEVEVELIIESKNDYEYLLLTDPKPAGAEATLTLSGYVPGSGISAYMEPRDQAVHFFMRLLPRGTHTLRYTLRAESPGRFNALPAIIQAMYAPELRGNSDDFRWQIESKVPR